MVKRYIIIDITEVIKRTYKLNLQLVKYYISTLTQVLKSKIKMLCTAQLKLDTYDKILLCTSVEITHKQKYCVLTQGPLITDGRNSNEM